MTGTRVPLLAMVAAAVSAVPAAAQGGVAVEARGGAGVGNHAAASSELGFHPGLSWGATVSYAAGRRVEVYAGYSRTRFGCGTGFCAGGKTTLTSRGVEAGVRASLPLPAAPWLRAGVVRHVLAYARSAGPGAPSGEGEARGTGLEAGGGVRVRLGRTLALTPGVRYVRYGAGSNGVAMVVGDVGLRFRL